MDSSYFFQSFDFLIQRLDFLHKNAFIPSLVNN